MRAARAGARLAGVQARRVVVDRVVVVSSRRYPRWATTHHETTRWFAERYNTVTTQSTVPNMDGVAWPLLALHSRLSWHRHGGRRRRIGGSSGGSDDDYEMFVVVE